MTTVIQPILYKIDITPDLDNFQFKGIVHIRLQAEAAVKTVTLHQFELAIWNCRLERGETWVPCAFGVEPDKEQMTVQLPEALSGELHLRIDYEGLINDQMAGFYRSSFERDGATHTIAVTQFQESSARRAFPCMDHPLYKAVFELSLTVRDELKALANTLPIADEHLADGRRRVTFAPTPRMSTYLLFFGVGAFEWVQDQDDPRVRVVHLPGLADTTASGLDFGRKSLQYCEDYYDIPYPLPKMDLIAVPDFAFGAMENWGAVTFRENHLLHFKGLTSKAAVQRIFEVTAHEIAHQWFGNLVTPSDWKYLWLNESFATYFGYGVVDHFYPDWGIWEQFLQGETATARSRDGLQETFAIEIPGGGNIAINSSTAPIIYNKGASILRMIKGHIGRELYQEGVRGYLRRHAYACAESHHLWEAFEEASRQPITAMMSSWISQPGHPIVTVSRNGDTISMRQKRFTYLDRISHQSWPIPLGLTIWHRDGQVENRSDLMAQLEMSLPLPKDTLAYKFNQGQTGFYRVAYKDQENLAALGGLIANRSMPATDRWGIENDLYAQVLQTSLPLSDYLAYLDYYDSEDAYLPLTSIAGHLAQLHLLLEGNTREIVARRGKALVERILSAIGYEPAGDEPQTTTLLREQLLWQAVLWGADQPTAFAAAQFEAMTAGRPVHADIARAAMQAGAATRGHAALDWLMDRFGRSPNEHERMNILAALGAFQQWETIARALDFALDKVPQRNRFIPIVAAAANPAARRHLWDWFLQNLAQLETFHPLLYERVITSVWPTGGLGREKEVWQFGEAYVQKRPGLTDAAKLALENLEINARLIQATME